MSGQLTTDDMQRIATVMPKEIRELLREETVFLAGGAIRSIISGEEVSDWDLFGPTAGELKRHAELLTAKRQGRLHSSRNAYTVLAPPRTPVQFISRWLYDDPTQLLQSFDFTIARAVIYFDRAASIWVSVCDPLFYPDLAAKRLRYMQPERNEDAGGSMLRAQKFMHRGYHIAPESLGKVMARMTMQMRDNDLTADEAGQAKVLTGLLRQVDPLLVIDGLEMPQEERDAGEAA